MGYGVWLVVYLLWEKRQSKQSASQANVPLPTQEEDAPEIVGKSSFRMEIPTPTAATPVPNATTSEKEEEVREEDVTFDSETEKKPSARISDNELDAVFTDLRIEDIMEDEEEDGDEEPPVEGYATQSGFEEINEAVITAKNPDATEEAKIQAGGVFSGLKGTELFEMFTARFSSIDGRITELMNAYLDNSVSDTTKKKKLVVPAQSENFDIRDYV
ncbi:MAG: conjugal transfer protein TraD [Odoribacter sp.]|nr:conjugal transfer protein TraD [Odoribacter sp.]